MFLIPLESTSSLLYKTTKNVNLLMELAATTFQKMCDFDSLASQLQIVLGVSVIQSTVFFDRDYACLNLTIIPQRRAAKQRR